MSEKECESRPIGIAARKTVAMESPNVSFDDTSKDASMTSLDELDNQPTKKPKLHVALFRKQTRLSTWYMNSAEQLNMINEQGLAPLHIAVMTHQAEMVRKLIVAGANRGTMTSAGCTALHLACDENDFAMVKALTEPLSDEEKDGLPRNLNHDLNSISTCLEIADRDGYTALHIAAVHDNVDMVKQLVKVGAKLDTIEGRFGRTPFHMAIENNARNVIEYIIDQNSAFLNMPTAQGILPYEIALSVDQQLAQDLLRRGADPTVRDPETYKSSDDSSTNSYIQSFSDESTESLRRYVHLLNNTSIES